MAYGLNRLEDALVIDIGAGTSDLCRMYGAMPERDDQETLNEAGDSIDEKLYELMKVKCTGADLNRNMVKNVKERFASVAQEISPVVVELPVRGKPTAFDVTDELREACRSIILPIVEAIHKLIGSFDPEFQDRLRNNVLLGGGGSQIIGLGPALEDEMKKRLGSGRVMTVEEPLYAGANGALKFAHDMPDSYWQKLS